MKTMFSLAMTALAVTNAQTNSSTKACSTVVDQTNPTFKAISSVVPLEFLSMLPKSWLGCIGSVNANTLVSDVMSAMVVEPTCLVAAPYLLPLLGDGKSKNSTNAGKNETNDDDDNHWSSYKSYIFNFPDSDVQKVCTPLTKSMACLKAGIVPAVFKQINTNPCCTAMVADIKAFTGEAPDMLVTSFVEKVSDVVCTIQTPGFNGTANQTCGYSWVKSFTQGISEASKESTAELIGRVDTALQIPNDQGCAAVNGNPFTSTTGASVSTLFVKPIVPGSCAKSADALLSWVRKFPALPNVTFGPIRALDLFEDKKCVKGSDIAAVIGVEYLFGNSNIKPSDFNSSCYHLSNGGFQTCSFADATAGQIVQNSTEATPATPKSAANSFAVSSMIATSAALIALMW
ncbi:hypothetical protein DYB32_005488 [Aphanomyces invadans]|uniref:Secreted protein n=1 Tax=Aphanomyces invadans TaxID=157072 RepID=A0A3R6WKX8_9STRA|nr:hypothetical protein DYB32_005488 [Aphanomyces invadans]